MDKRIRKKVKIFEDAEEPEVHDHAEREHGFSRQAKRSGKQGEPPEQAGHPTALFPVGAGGDGFVQIGNPKTEPAVHDGGKHNEAEKTPVPPAVKQVAGQQANPQPAAAFCPKIEWKKSGDENEKSEAVKNHVRVSGKEAWTAHPCKFQAKFLKKGSSGLAFQVNF